MTNPQESERDPLPEVWQPLVLGHLAGDAVATDSLAGMLVKPARQAAAMLLGHQDADVDDVVAESVLSILQYILRRGRFEGNIFKFTVTVARNRCRNLILSRASRNLVPDDFIGERVASGDDGPLDKLLKKEQQELLQAALAELSRECEDLLRSFYLDGASIEDIRVRQGLDTVQGVYYRRSICLEKVFRLLNKRLATCSYEQRPNHVRGLPSPGGDETHG